MLRVFLLLCLILQENFVFTTKRVSRTFAKTLPSVEQNRTYHTFGKILVNSTILVQFVNSAGKLSTTSDKRSIKKNKQRINETKRKNLKGIVDQQTFENGENAAIRSIIPFTEAPMSVQFNEENTESRVVSKESNLKSRNVFSSTRKGCVKPPLASQLKGDLKLSSKHPYYGWPYFFHNPQIYERLEDISEKEKAKDKRYTDTENAVDTDVIPLQTNIPKDGSQLSSGNQVALLPSQYAQDADNPMFGDQAFFSFILNDYFDKSIEEDPTLFKDLHWGKEFDSEFTAQIGDIKRIRRLENDHLRDNSIETSTLVNLDIVISGEDERSNTKVRTKAKHSETCKGFKDFVEKFAQKFGTKDSISVMSKGEQIKKSESHLITTRKDEFQEASELLDELVTNYNDDKADEKDTFMTTISDFEEFLNAHETPSMFNEVGDMGMRATSVLSRFRHVAKNAALVNNADYIDTSEYAI